jgi:hypothetical protein
LVRWSTFDFNWEEPPFLALAAFSAFLALAIAVFWRKREKEGKGVSDGRRGNVGDVVRRYTVQND